MTPTFFSADNNKKAEELRAYLPVNVNLDFGTIAPALHDAEERYIKPVIGGTLWETLSEYYHTEERDSDGIKDDIIQSIQAAVVRIAYYESFDLLAVNLTDSGVQNPNGDKAAYRYQADAAKETLGRQAFDALQTFFDALVASGLREWVEGEVSPIDSHSLFRDCGEFFAAIQQQRDFRLFMKLKPSISIDENVSLCHYVGSDIARSLREREARVSPAMLLLAQRYVAYDTLASCVVFLGAYIGADGATIRSINADGANGGASLQPADIKVREELKKHYQEAAEASATQLVRLLQGHADAFPEISRIYPTDRIERRTPTNNHKHLFRT